MNRYDTSENPKAEISLEPKGLTEKQKRMFREWIALGDKCDKAKTAALFDEFGTVLDHDVYLYRGVCIRHDLSRGLQCNFLNSIVEGGIIDNSTRYTSTAADINRAYESSESGFNTTYILKIKVPKGTRVLDIRHYYTTGNCDEFVLPPSSYKVNHIDYSTGIVDCDFISQ